MNRYFITFLTLFLSLVVYSQEKAFKVETAELGFYDKSGNFGGFDGAIGYFKLQIDNVQLVDNQFKINGTIVDKETGESFCGIKAFVGKRKETKILNLKEFEIDCSGNFEIVTKIERENKLYFHMIGYSLLECEFTMTRNYHCDIEVIKEIRRNLDKVNSEMLVKFLKSFQETCNNNAEFSQAANWNLFYFLSEHTDLTLKVIAETQSDNEVDTDWIISQFESPVSDDIDIKTIYGKVKNRKLSETSERILSSLELAAKKGNLKLN